MAAGGIFISYRRDDTRQAAGRLGDDLADHFGSAKIFRDIDNIELGVDFTVALNQALGSCAVMLVLIGHKWLDMRTAAGSRRLDDPKDWIRQEIATALHRGIRVVPVLIDGAELPDESALPDDLKPLVRRQKLDVDDARWRGDLAKLVDTLARLPGLERKTPPPPPPPPPPSGKGSLWKGVGIGVVGLLVVSALMNLGADETPGPAPGPSPAPSPSPAPAPAALPNLAGFWRTNGGETYQFTQDGRQVQFRALAQGIDIGGGGGELEGSLLRLSMTLSVQGLPPATANCNMQAAPDFRSFTGMCSSPNGAFAAHFFR
jgi:hypothetical protein